MPPKYQAPVIFEVGGRKTRLAVIFISLVAVVNLINALVYLVWPDRDLLPTGGVAYWARWPGALIAMGATITFLFWFFRAYKNITLFAPDGRKFSPGWAVAGYLVPVINLVIPFLVAREIWKASTPGLEKDDIFAWRRAPVASFINLWWLAFIFSETTGLAGGTTAVILKALQRQKIISSDVPNRYMALVLAFSGLLFVIYSLLKIIMIRRIDQRQSQRHLELGDAA